MEDDLILNRPSDRRILDDKNLYPGPPGVESDAFEIQELEKWNPTYLESSKKDKSPLSKSSNSRRIRRKSKSRSRERKSRSRERVRRSRERSAERRTRRRFDYNITKEPAVRIPRGRGPTSPRPRERSRGRDSSRERNRYRRAGRNTPSPKGGRNRWSPKSSPNSNQIPVAPPPPVVSQIIPQQPYPPPPPIIFNDGYNNNYNSGVGYGQNQQQYNSYNDGYGNNAQSSNFQQQYIPPPPVLSQPVPPGDDYSTPQSWSVPPPPIINSINTQQHQQPPPVQHSMVMPDEDKIKREAAVAQEMQNQRQQLKKQRAEYQKRASALKRELKILKEQRNDLNSGNEPPSPTTKGFIKENDRLQSQIQNKLNTIENVIDMLSGIIGKDTSRSPTPDIIKSPIHTKKHIKAKSPISDRESSPDVKPTKSSSEKVLSKVKPEKPAKREKSVEKSVVKEEIIEPKKSEDEKNKINYVYYDPEMHWCKNCDVFPKTAKDYLNHLHSKEHLDIIRELDEESPWHDSFVSDDLPTYPNAPSKRTPIRGLQFFVPSTAWYCKLCNIWMGDLRCASLHLKSSLHAEKYTKYVEQNPHFEVDWMADRQKAYEKYRDKVPPVQLPVASKAVDHFGFEGIPLQILKNYDSDSSKKKKKVSKNRNDDGKKDKKKKKKSKKRRQDSSSSSSSSSDDTTDTESEQENSKVESNIDTSNSIRVAMRNLLKGKPLEKTEEVGRWTVIQPSNNGTKSSDDVNDLKKKDELIISQWATPEPIISESEKKLLEDLKGKLKKKSNPKEEEAPPAPPVGVPQKRERNYREREKDTGMKDKPRDPRDRLRDGRRSRDREREYYERRYDRRRRGSRSRSRSRNRRSRSRSPMMRRYRRRYSRSRSRSRSRIIEKPIVNYPPEPRQRPEKKKIMKHDEDSNKKSPNAKKLNIKSLPGAKKLPFIGRMPVFKKHNLSSENDKKPENNVAPISNEMGPAPPPPSYIMTEEGIPHMLLEDDDDLMPDPAQLMAIMATAPPPPPMMPMPAHDKNEVVLPPGIDENEADFVPKPISEAPRPRKGPLPKDFQDALNIIFPGEKKPEDAAPIKNAEEKVAETNLNIVTEPMIISDDLSQQSLEQMYGQFFTNPRPIYEMYEQHPSADLPLDIRPVPPPSIMETPTVLPYIPPPLIDKVTEPEIKQKSPIVEKVETKSPPRLAEKQKKKGNQAELDDLAMLGIDADDLAAQYL